MTLGPGADGIACASSSSNRAVLQEKDLYVVKQHFFVERT